MTSAKNWPCAALYQADFASRTTLRVGGSVQWLLEPGTPGEFADAWCAALERGYRPRVLGGGANLLIADGLHRGVVLTTERMSRVFRPDALEDVGWMDDRQEDERDSGAEEPLLFAWAGYGMPGLVRTARDLGLTGLEGLVGVPGHVGGGVAMNAGGRWGELWDVVEEVHLLTPEGEHRLLKRDECTPGYRDGNLGGCTVLAATFRLKRGNPPEIRARIKQYLHEKSVAQPLTEHSSGCVFRNPDPDFADGRSAGQLIDECGLGGRTRGDAQVSPKHANFIVNRGKARSADVLALIEEVRETVLDRTGIELEQEVKVWDREPEAVPAF